MTYIYDIKRVPFNKISFFLKENVEQLNKLLNNRDRGHIIKKIDVDQHYTSNEEKEV